MRWDVVVVIIGLALAACGTDPAPTDTTGVPPTTTGSPTTTGAPPTTTAAPDPSIAVATFETPDGERYRLALSGPDVGRARDALATGESPGIPNGMIQRGDGGINVGHDWHVVDVELVDMAIELCDGTVSYIDGLGYEGYVAQHGDRFCPWGAVLVSIE